MNQDELKYRFTEIATTIDLLPEVNMEDDSTPETSDWVLPNGTLGLSNPALYSALICQTLKGGQDYRFKMVATLSNTALNSIKNKDSQDEAPNIDDLTAIAISINILWANGVANGLMQMMGMLVSIANRHDLEIPDLALAVFRPQSKVDKFNQLDPMRILDGQAVGDVLDMMEKED